MIPLKDHHPTTTTPFITYLLLAANILVFLFMYTLPLKDLEQVIQAYAIIPAEIARGQNPFTLFSAMFMHGSLGHLVGNMLFLNIFGDNLEDRFGHLKYLLFYLISGLAASALQILVNPTSTVPNLGASGAIAGLMGGYLLLYPHHRIDVLFPIAGFFRRSTVPAITMLGYWFIFQLFSGFGSLATASTATGGVAYFAHLGGFIAGVALALPARFFSPSRS